MTGSLDGLMPPRAIVAAAARCATLYNFHSRFGACPDPGRHERELHQSRNRSRPAPFKYCREHVTGEGVLDGLGRAKPGPPSLDFARTDYAVGGKHKR